MTIRPAARRDIVAGAELTSLCALPGRWHHLLRRPLAAFQWLAAGHSFSGNRLRPLRLLRLCRPQGPDPAVRRTRRKLCGSRLGPGTRRRRTNPRPHRLRDFGLPHLDHHPHSHPDRVGGGATAAPWPWSPARCRSWSVSRSWPEWSAAISLCFKPLPSPTAGGPHLRPTVRTSQRASPCRSSFGALGWRCALRRLGGYPQLFAALAAVSLIAAVLAFTAERT